MASSSDRSGSFEILLPWMEELDKRQQNSIFPLWEEYQAGSFPVAGSSSEHCLQLIPSADLLVIKHQDEKSERVVDLQVQNFGADNLVGNNFMGYTCRPQCIAFKGEKRYLKTFLDFVYGFTNEEHHGDMFFKMASEVRFPDQGLPEGLEYVDFASRVEIVEYAIWLKEGSQDSDPEETTMTILNVTKDGEEIVAPPTVDSQYEADISQSTVSELAIGSMQPAAEVPTIIITHPTPFDCSVGQRQDGVDTTNLTSHPSAVEQLANSAVAVPTREPNQEVLLPRDETVNETRVFQTNDKNESEPNMHKTKPHPTQTNTRWVEPRTSPGTFGATDTPRTEVARSPSGGPDYSPLTQKKDEAKEVVQNLIEPASPSRPVPWPLNQVSQSDGEDELMSDGSLFGETDHIAECHLEPQEEAHSAENNAKTPEVPTKETADSAGFIFPVALQEPSRGVDYPQSGPVTVAQPVIHTAKLTEKQTPRKCTRSSGGPKLNWSKDLGGSNPTEAVLEPTDEHRALTREKLASVPSFASPLRSEDRIDPLAGSDDGNYAALHMSSKRHAPTGIGRLSPRKKTRINLHTTPRKFHTSHPSGEPATPVTPQRGIATRTPKTKPAKFFKEGIRRSSRNSAPVNYEEQ